MSESRQGKYLEIYRQLIFERRSTLINEDIYSLIDIFQEENQ